MDSNLSSPTQENSEPKAEFRKLTNEAVSRKYRRRSPVSGSSDGDGSPNRDDISRGKSKASYHEGRNYDKTDERSSSRSQHGRNGDSYRHSSKGSRHDEHSRHGKHADEDDRSHAISSRSGRDSRGGTNTDYRDRESDYNRSKDHYRDVSRYTRDKSDRTRYDGRHGGRYDDRDRHSRVRDHHRDEKREYKSSRDHRGERMASNENSMGRQNDSNSNKREIGDMRDVDGSKDSQDKSENEELDRHEDRRGRAGGRSDDRSAYASEAFASKKTKFSLSSNFRKGSEQGDDCVAKSSPERGPVSGADSVSSVDAAKVAAMKAAQLVNQNLTSTGFMTADQKKKLLWGNKKSNVAEESSHHWDTSLFPDRERQEKFHKLMGVKGEVKVDPKSSSSQDAEKQSQLQLDLEKQYTAGLRRRDGRTVGLGL